jgi:hypothetical protein
LLDVFEPDSERMLAKSDFRAYKQAADEDVGQYLSTKWEMFRVAFPETSLNKDETAYETFRSEVIRGLFSPIIKRIITRKTTSTEEELRTACLEAVSAEREAFSLGCSEAANLDGLASVTRGHQRRRQGEESSSMPTPMEINLMKNGTCHFCGAAGHHQAECRKRLRAQGEKPKKVEGRNANMKNREKKKEDRKCFNCDKEGHLARDCWKKTGKRPAKKGVHQLNGKEDEDAETWNFYQTEDQINSMESFLGAQGRR